MGPHRVDEDQARRPDFAQGGAPDASKAEEGLAAVKAALAG
jgi:alanyl-tRNA synthetase